MRALNEVGRTTESIEILDRIRVLPSEHAAASHGLFVQAHTTAALDALGRSGDRDAIEHLEMALTWPERLGLGRPYEPEERLVRYLMGLASSEAGDRQGADEAFGCSRVDDAADPGVEQVHSGLRSLKSNWRRFQSSMHEVQADCSGYRRARRSSCGSYTVSGRQTADCQDATQRARLHLPMLESQYAEICNTARRNGLTPGDLRDVLNQSSMADFDSMIDNARDKLDAIQDGIEQ